jgi:hypothetical protein
MVAFIVTRDRFSATKTEVRLALIAREGKFAINAESFVTLCTIESIYPTFPTEGLLALLTEGEGIIIAIFADCLVALVADDPIFALKTKRLLAFITEETVFAIITECRVASFAAAEVFAVVAECHVALGTDEHIRARKTR